jgi:hypothetical protein
MFTFSRRVTQKKSLQISKISGHDDAFGAPSLDRAPGVTRAFAVCSTRQAPAVP